MSREYVVPSVAVFQEFAVVQPDAGRPNRNGDIFPPQTLRDAIAFNESLIADNQVMRDHIATNVSIFTNQLGIPPTVFRGDDMQAGGLTQQMLADSLRLLGQGRIREANRVLGWIVDKQAVESGELHNFSEHLFWWNRSRDQ